jgi:hypothetical protein
LLRVFQLPTTTMLGRSFAVLALAGSAAAFSPMMSMEIGRREIVQAGAAAAAAAPLLRANPASAKYDQVMQAAKNRRVPVNGAVNVRGRVSWIVKMTGRGTDSRLPLFVQDS